MGALAENKTISCDAFAVGRPTARLLYDFSSVSVRPSAHATILRTSSGPSCRWLRMIPSLGHQRSHRYSAPLNLNFRTALQHTLHEWIEVQIVGRSALARQKLMGTPVSSQLRSRRPLKPLPGKGGCLWCSVREDRQRRARNDHVSSREVKMAPTEEP